MAVGETYGVRWGWEGGETYQYPSLSLSPPLPPLPPPRTISFTNSHGGLTLFRVVVENIPPPFREELFSLNNPFLWK